MKLQNLSHTILPTFLFLSVTLSHSWPLSTSSRWVVDKSGRRVKLTCANWSGHLHAMVPEGIDKRPIKVLAANVSSMGFNCVRLSYATYMLTKPGNTNITVAQSLKQWNLTDAIAGVGLNNPKLLSLKLIDAQQAVVDKLGKHKVMVILDNHVSLPIWCCADTDGNGFFGDMDFDPKDWLQGLTTIAKHYKGNHGVVGMSLRNELRGSRQNSSVWYEYMQQGAMAIHRENPDVLVVVSGLAYDTNLDFLKQRPFQVDFTSKLVFEAHWYSFGDPTDKWMYQTNEYCANRTGRFVGQTGFLISNLNPFPLWVSEFGADQRGLNEAENRYFTCALAYLADKDIDWALWTLQGSTILRQGKLNEEETYGMFDKDWVNLRNASFPQRLQLIKQMTQEPNSKYPYYFILHHPKSGLCVHVDKNNVFAGDCKKWSRWSYSGNGNGSPIRLLGSTGCLNVAGEGLPVTLSNNCSSQRSLWKPVSKSGFHLAAQDGQGKSLCLDWNSANSTILTQKCLCLGNALEDVPRCTDDPTKQWFKLVSTNLK
ncbi:glycosyl hydrolase 5 family protein-like [Cornus florida]|uniref:glycosyl hydrolase 5 family protein-like n=1 Tax=Cornus florida TaxID=4283 RepID=UPI002898F41F|nr:glycosyl hydrolase 5 family protein-like [Cornus florida]